MALHDTSHLKKNPVFRFSDQVPHKPGCTVTEDVYRLEILDLGSKNIVQDFVFYRNGFANQQCLSTNTRLYTNTCLSRKMSYDKGSNCMMSITQNAKLISSLYLLVSIFLTNYKQVFL